MSKVLSSVSRSPGVAVEVEPLPGECLPRSNLDIVRGPVAAGSYETVDVRASVQTCCPHPFPCHGEMCSKHWGVALVDRGQATRGSLHGERTLLAVGGRPGRGLGDRHLPAAGSMPRPEYGGALTALSSRSVASRIVHDAGSRDGVVPTMHEAAIAAADVVTDHVLAGGRQFDLNTRQVIAVCSGHDHSRLHALGVPRGTRALRDRTRYDHGPPRNPPR